MDRKEYNYLRVVIVSCNANSCYVIRVDIIKKVNTNPIRLTNYIKKFNSNPTYLLIVLYELIRVTRLLKY